MRHNGEKVGNILVGNTKSGRWANLRLPDPDGTWRLTSPVASWDESTRIVTTASGSVYDLTEHHLAVVGGPENGANFGVGVAIRWADIGCVPYPAAIAATNQPKGDEVTHE